MTRSNSLVPNQTIIDLCKKIFKKHPDHIHYTAVAVREILYAFGLEPSIDPELQKLLQLPSESHPVESDGATSSNRELFLEEEQFRKEIIDFYIPRQLIDAIVANRGIPKDSIETQIGVGFIDVADYTFLAKFLSPKENQILLNGLYTSFAHILKKHGGFLNKTEGDSIMFHFGGLIDPKVKNLSPQKALTYISSELFYTCVEMQKTCDLFNEANPALIDQLVEQEEKDAVQAAFQIIHFMRNESV
ncbi:MAG: adenylate/guanylate cyclase domain-containing protein, partial [Spirochaetales bacterium]